MVHIINSKNDPFNRKNDKDPNKRLEERISFILMKSGVTGPEIDECILWAFGPHAWYVPIYPDWVDRWNKLHPRAVRVKKSDNFVEWIYVVGKIFCHIKEHGDDTGPGRIISGYSPKQGE